MPVLHLWFRFLFWNFVNQELKVICFLILKETNALFDIFAHKCIQKKVIKLKAVDEIFENENTEFEILDRENPVLKFCNKYHISLPENNLSNVKIEDNIFDLVWNGGSNRLYYLKFFDPSSPDCGRDVKLEEIRRYINYQNQDCTNRHCLGYFSSAADKERFEYDSKRYGISLGFSSKIDPNLKEKIDRELCKTLKSYFEPKNHATASGECEDFIIDSDTVICPMDLSEELNLNIVESYKQLYRNLVFCVSDPLRFNRLIDYLNDVYMDKGKLNIRYYYTDPFCSDIYERFKIKKGAGNISVNVTPGSKGQTANLSVWAEKYSIPVCTIVRATEKISCLNHNIDPIEYKIVSPLSFPSVYDKILEKDELDNPEDLKFFETLAKLMDRWCQNNERWAINKRGVRSPNETKLEDGSYFYSRECLSKELKSFKYSILTPYGETLIYPNKDDEKVNDGTFYESIICYLIKSTLSPKYCYSHLRLGYSEKTQSKLEERNKFYGKDNDVFRSDFDVLFTYSGNHVLCECKAQTSGNVKYNIKSESKEVSNEEIAEKAQLCATNITRFCIPVIAFLNKGPEEEYIETGTPKVYVIDWIDFFLRDEKGKTFAENIFGKAIRGRSSITDKA